MKMLPAIDRLLHIQQITCWTHGSGVSSVFVIVYIILQIFMSEYWMAFL